MNHRRGANELPRVTELLNEIKQRFREMDYEERLALFDVLRDFVKLDPTPTPNGNVDYIRVP
jgi:hypothetical protein